MGRYCQVGSEAKSTVDYVYVCMCYFRSPLLAGPDYVARVSVHTVVYIYQWLEAGIRSGYVCRCALMHFYSTAFRICIWRMLRSESDVR